MARLNRELGDAAFPTISQNYFAGFEEMMYTQAFPAVIKIGSAHAGMGKARVEDHHAMDDMRSLLAVSGGKYATCEPFVEARCDLRIQKIGARVRVFRRTGMSGDWKTNTGSAMIEEIAVAPRYRAWAEAAATMFGGTTREPLDILTVDALIDEAGREVILEVNGSSSGLAPDAEDEDNQHIRELVLQKMSARLAERAATAVGAVAVKAAAAAAAEATAAGAEAAEAAEAAAAEATDTAADGRTTAAVERDER